MQLRKGTGFVMALTSNSCCGSDIVVSRDVPQQAAGPPSATSAASKLMVESGHKLVENDPMSRIPRGRETRSFLAKGAPRRMVT